GEAEADDDRFVVDLHGAEEGGDLALDIDILGAKQIDEDGDGGSADLVERGDGQGANLNALVGGGNGQDIEGRGADARQRVGGGASGALIGLKQQGFQLRNCRGGLGSDCAEDLHRHDPQILLVALDRLN